MLRRRGIGEVQAHLTGWTPLPQEPHRVRHGATGPTRATGPPLPEFRARLLGASGNHRARCHRADAPDRGRRRSRRAGRRPGRGPGGVELDACAEGPCHWNDFPCRHGKRGGHGEGSGGQRLPRRGGGSPRPGGGGRGRPGDA
ncbi:MAG: hypothetical protein EA350_07420 [Gemmatimonadales bacterium]|nr:MAG: hypothetical protein EA350_07420 [Gemmatimonadales bacterium]